MYINRQQTVHTGIWETLFGHFSASPCVSIFFVVVSHFQASVRHLEGKANVISDFGSRTAPEYQEETNRRIWCLPKYCAGHPRWIHKEAILIISLLVKQEQALVSAREHIIVLTTLHIRLDHLSCHELKLAACHYFYAFEMKKSLDRVSKAGYIAENFSFYEQTSLQSDTARKKMDLHSPQMLSDDMTADTSHMWNSDFLHLSQFYDRWLQRNAAKHTHQNYVQPYIPWMYPWP